MAGRKKTPGGNIRQSAAPRASRYPNLTKKQEMFALYYFETGNATDAFRRAYEVAWKPAAISVAASTLLKNDKVQVRLKELEVKLRAESDVTVERIKRELAINGYSDMADYAEWGPNGVRLKASDTLGDKSRAVKEVSQTRSRGETTLTFKLHDKLAALDKLARHMGMYSDAAVNLQINVVKRVVGVAPTDVFGE